MTADREPETLVRRPAKILLICVAVAVGVALLLVSPFALTLAYYSLVPVAAAEQSVPELDAKVGLKLYLVPPYLLAEYDRYLEVTTRAGTASKKMGVDWGGASRTGLYRTPDKRLVILGPAGDNYSISLSPIQIDYPQRQSSDDWLYLGAFDIHRDYSSGQSSKVFRFFTASEQAECIPSLEVSSIRPFRAAAYRERC